MNYYMFYAVITPGKDPCDPEKVSERTRRLLHVFKDEKAISQYHQFAVEEECLSQQQGFRYVMGDLVKVEVGRITKIPTENGRH